MRRHAAKPIYDGVNDIRYPLHITYHVSHQHDLRKEPIKKVAIGVDATCLASDNSGAGTNGRGAVAIAKPSNPSFAASHNHVVFSDEVVL